MTIKSALSVIALAAGLVAGPAIAQSATLPTMIGGITVPEAEAGAVKARCDELKLAAGESLVEESDSDTDDDASEADDVAGKPDADGATAVTVDLELVTLEDCEADGWLTEM